MARLRGLARAVVRALWPAGAAASSLIQRIGPLRVLAVVVLLVALGGGWLWFRDSSLVSVKQVKVTGATGPEASRIRAALTDAARTMTTLDVQRARLETAAAPYPAVKSLQVATSFPHELTIHVVEELPAAILAAGNHRVAVAADGVVLRTARRSMTNLPVIAVNALPVASRVADPAQRQELAVLAGAPRSFDARISAVTDSVAHGISLKLRAGSWLYFGTASQVHDKWLAAVAVLGNSGSAGATYIDVSDPSRPAAG